MIAHNILSLSSSFSPSSLYISYGGLSFCAFSSEHPSSGLIKILEKSRKFIPPADLKYIAVDVGPGGFTSTRLAISLATGIASVCHIPIIPIKSLEALAAKAFRERNYSSVIVSLMLKKDLVVVSSYEITDSFLRESFSPCVMSKNELQVWFEKNDGYNRVLYGTGFSLLHGIPDNSILDAGYHTARDIHSAAMLVLSDPARCCSPSEIRIDYAIPPSALTLDEQKLLLQG